MSKRLNRSWLFVKVLPAYRIQCCKNWNFRKITLRFFNLSPSSRLYVVFPTFRHVATVATKENGHWLSQVVDNISIRLPSQQSVVIVARFLCYAQAYCLRVLQMNYFCFLFPELFAELAVAQFATLLWIGDCAVAATIDINRYFGDCLTELSTDNVRST